MSKNLILYFSHKGENYFGGAIRNISKGNSEIAAQTIQKAIDGDLVEIETLEDYPVDYQECTEYAKEELQKHARPALKSKAETAEGYDNIVVVGPCWWGTYPMAVFSQLDQLDLNGKNLYPVMTHEGSRMGHSVQDLKKDYPGAIVHDGLAIHGSEVNDCQPAVEAWAASIN